MCCVRIEEMWGEGLMGSGSENWVEAVKDLGVEMRREGIEEGCGRQEMRK